jgi:hypothetical protein
MLNISDATFDLLVKPLLQIVEKTEVGTKLDDLPGYFVCQTNC